MGLFFSELSVGTPTVESSATRLFKELSMSNLVLYVDVESPPLTDEQCSSFDKLSSCLAPKPTTRTHGVVLHPGPARNITMLLRQNSNADTKIPAFEATVDFQKMHFTLQKQQFAAVTAFTESSAKFTIQHRYQYLKGALLYEYKLPNDCRPKGRDAIRLWWKYAIRCVLSGIKEKNGKIPRTKSPAYRSLWRKNFAKAYMQRLKLLERSESTEIDAKMPGVRELEWEDIQLARQHVLDYRYKHPSDRSEAGLDHFIMCKEVEDAIAPEYDERSVGMLPYKPKHGTEILGRMSIGITHFQFDLSSDNPKPAALASATEAAALAGATEPDLARITLDHPTILAVVRKDYLSVQVEAWDFKVEDQCTKDTKFSDAITRLPQHNFSVGERVQVRDDPDWSAGHVSRVNKNGTYDITLDNELEKLSVLKKNIRSVMFSLGVDAPPLEDALRDVYHIAMVPIKHGSASRLIKYAREVDLVKVGFRGLNKVQAVEVQQDLLMIISVYNNSANAANSTTAGTDKKTPLDRYSFCIPSCSWAEFHAAFVPYMISAVISHT